MKWAKSAKKLKKYKVVLIKDYVDVINIALKQKADIHYQSNKHIKNKGIIQYNNDNGRSSRQATKKNRQLV